MQLFDQERESDVGKSGNYERRDNEKSVSIVGR